MLISLVVMPGSGQRNCLIDNNTTMSSFVEAENLQGRQMCVNGVILPEEEWGSYNVFEHAQAGTIELGALEGSKGNLA